MNSELRNRALKARRSMSQQERQIANQIINQKVARSRDFFAARTVGLYLPMRDEVDPTEIIERAWRANKRVFCPVIGAGGQMSFHYLGRNTTLLRNDYGIWEPTNNEMISSRDLDLVITPLVAFDRNKNRIGMGGGYFDRCFSFLRHRKNWLRPKLLGVAFACQEVERIHPNPWDIRLYGICSDID
ncbi:MAG: 5-formyltetrahydrofolate cyclo-ligase [Woeseiaceae bacterium]